MVKVAQPVKSLQNRSVKIRELDLKRGLTLRGLLISSDLAIWYDVSRGKLSVFSSTVSTVPPGHGYLVGAGVGRCVANGEGGAPAQPVGGAGLSFLWPQPPIAGGGVGAGLPANWTLPSSPPSHPISSRSSIAATASTIP